MSIVINIKALEQRNATQVFSNTDRWHYCFPESYGDLIREEFQLGPVDDLGGLVVIAPARRAGDPGSNPGPGENSSLKLLIYDLSESYSKSKISSKLALFFRITGFLGRMKCMYVQRMKQESIEERDNKNYSNTHCQYVCVYVRKIQSLECPYLVTVYIQSLQ